MRELVEGDEHERAALAGGRRRLDEQELLTPSFVRTLLHGPHAQRIGLGRTAIMGVETDGTDLAALLMGLT